MTEHALLSINQSLSQDSLHLGMSKMSNSSEIYDMTGADPGFDQGGGAQIVTGLKLPFWGLSFVEFWCWGLIFGGQGGARAPGAPPWIRPCMTWDHKSHIL